jgi:CBS domain-containing protein
MLVKEVMAKNLVAISSNKTVYDAAYSLKENKIGSIIAIDIDGDKGIVTKRDIIGGTILARKNPEETSISEIMNRNIITIRPMESLETAVEKMIKHQIKKLIVVEQDRIVGVITSTDISRATNNLIKRALNTCLNETSRD